MNATLILHVTAGPQQGESFEVPPQGGSIGRSVEADVHLDDVECSRLHGHITVDDSGFSIQDNNSTNGIFVNGAKISGQHLLGNGDSLRLGVTSLRVQISTAPNSAKTLRADETQVNKVPAPAVAPEEPPEPATVTVASDRSAMRSKDVGTSSALVGKLLVTFFAALAIAGGVWWLMAPGPTSSPSDSSGTAAASDSPAAEPDGPTETAISGPSEAPIAETIGTDLPNTDTVTIPQPDMPVDDATEEADDFLPQLASSDDGQTTPPAEAATPPPEPAPAAATSVEGESTDPAIADFLWLDTIPSGATVEFNGDPKGTTPLLLEALPEGRHMVRFTLPHYEPLSKMFTIPYSGIKQTFELRQLNSTCRITSEPSGAFVQRGPQFVGRTPLVLHDLPPGEQTVQLNLPGYEAADLVVTIDPDRPTQASVTLAPNTGSIIPIAIPGNVEIFVDDLPKGTTSPSGEPTGQSLPLRLPGFSTGKHQVYATWQGIRSPTAMVEVTAGGEIGVRLIVFVPNLEVTLTNDSKLQLMKVGEAEDAYLVITPRFEPVRLAKERVKTTRDIPLDEARQLLQRK